MRPRSLGEVVGQEHLLATGKFLRNAVDSGDLPSIVLWGPPGCGKTTLSRLLADAVSAEFIALSGVLSSVKDIRAAVDQARQTQGMFRRPTVLFVDEIHRFNKAQQDALLPHVERGTITLVGATTEHPGHEVRAALLSRAKVLILHPLSEDDVTTILERALTDPQRGLAQFGVQATDEAKAKLIAAAHGDARQTLNTLETASRAAFARAMRQTGSSSPDAVVVTEDDVTEALQGVTVRYDRDGDHHYRNVSAFIKSMRASDPNAAAFYMARMLEGGEDPKFLIRRMIIFASEDVGLADPQALPLAVSALHAFEAIGMPEAWYTITHVATYLASAPKSRAAASAMSKARAAAKEHEHRAVPAHLVNTTTSIDRDLGISRKREPGEQVSNLPEGIEELVVFVPDQDD